jgi:hypothetical protein
MEQRVRQRDVLALILLAAVATAVFADILFLGSNLWFRDLPRYFYPIKKLVRDALTSGEFPFWTRTWSAGQPVAANPAFEIFYPPQLLLLLPDFDLGYRLHLFLHVLIALAGMYVLLRSLRCQPPAAGAGAVAFGLGGPLMSTVALTSIFFAVSWWPWIAWAVRRYLRSGASRDLGIASLVIGAEFLICEPVSLLQIGFLLVTYLVGKIMATKADGPSTRQLIGRFSLAGTGGLLIGAVQLFPGMDHARDTIRARGYSFQAASLWSTPPFRWLELLHPRLSGSFLSPHPAFWAARSYPGELEPFILSFYVGIAASVLLLSGMILRVRGWALTAVVGGGAAILSLGRFTPLFGLLYRAGLFRSLRYPEKFSLLATFVVVAFSSVVLEKVLSGDRRAARVAAFVAMSVAGALMILLLWWKDPLRFSSYWSLPPSVAFHFSRLFIRETAAAAIRSALLALLLLLAWRRKGLIVAPLFLIFVALDVVPLSNALLFRTDSEFYNRAPAAAAGLAGGAGRLLHLAELESVPPYMTNHFALGESVAWFIRNGLLPRTPTIWNISTVLELDFDGTTLNSSNALEEAMIRMHERNVPLWQQKLMAMSNVSAWTRIRPFTREELMGPESFRRIRPVDVVPVPVSPRYYFADRVVSIGTIDDFVSSVAGPGWTPRSAAVAGPSFKTAPGTILKVRESQNSAVIDYSAAAPALLVASVTSHRWWQAEVDGAPVALGSVNLAYQGAIVPPGRHRFTMTYSNPLVIGFGLLSAAAFCLAMGLAVTSRRKVH